MKVTESEAVEAQSKQRAASKRATLAKLKNKKPREKEVTVTLGDEEMTILLRAISSAEYDALLDEHPPTKDQRAEGATFNSDTFPPALFSRVCVEPKVSYEDALEIWESGGYSRGDIGALWNQSLALIMEGFDVPLSSRG